MDEKYRVGGYVKRAKLNLRNGKDVRAFHKLYYEDKFSGIDDCELVDVYIDITGNKEIAKRPEMIRLMRDCADGKINLIATETKAYLAANVLPTVDMLLMVFFNDGDVKEFNVRALLDEHPEFAELEDRELFKKVTVEPGGYGISWNERLDCSETELYENGESIAYDSEDDSETQEEPAVMTANCRKTFAVNPDKTEAFLDVAGDKEQQEKNDKILSNITITRNEKE